MVQREVALAPATLWVKAQAEMEQEKDAAQQEKVQAQLLDVARERDRVEEVDPDQEHSRESRFKAATRAEATLQGLRSPNRLLMV